jgi:hypothetical protein
MKGRRLGKRVVWRAPRAAWSAEGRRLAARIVALGVAVAFAVVGCAEGGEDEVASLSVAEQDIPHVKGVAEQVRSAEAFHACLVDAGLPAVMEVARDGQIEVRFDAPKVVFKLPSRDAYGRGPRYSSSGYGSTPNEEMEIAFDLVDAAPDGIGLVIGTTDHSEVFRACHDESGFLTPIYWTVELWRDFQARQLADGIEWAACARDHGYPSIADPEPPDPTAMETADVFLPRSITPEELRALLDVCPPFQCDAAWDAENSRANGLWIDRPVDAQVMPALGLPFEEQERLQLITFEAAYALGEALEAGLPRDVAVAACENAYSNN